MARKTVRMTVLEERLVDPNTKFVRVQLEVPGEFSLELSNNVRADLEPKDILRIFVKDFLEAYRRWLKTPKTYEEEVEVEE